MATADFGPDSGGRLKGVTITKPVVYGNIARAFGKKRDEDGHTHSWSVYVKPYTNEDMSTYVKKVQFKLHESYPNPLRVVTRPPYELTETGWGEFEVIIKIFFNDPNERPVTLYHFLRLFHSHTDVMLGKKNLINEHYDELLVQDPTALMHSLLLNTQPISAGAYKHETDFEERKSRTLNNILNAKKKIRYEINELKERLKTNKDAIQQLKAQISQAEEQEHDGIVT